MFYCFLPALIVIAIAFQELVPAISWAYEARLFIVPVMYLTAAVSVPFPVMLALAFFTGLVWDARHLTLIGEASVDGLGGWAESQDLAFGYSIVLYAILGLIMQGIRPMFRRGRWELPVIFTGIGTFLLLALEYVLINLRRGGFHFPSEVWYKISATAVLSMMIAPLVFFLLYRLGRSLRYDIRYNDLSYPMR